MSEREQQGHPGQAPEAPGHHPDPDPDELGGGAPPEQPDPADEPPGHDPDPDPDEL